MFVKQHVVFMLTVVFEITWSPKHCFLFRRWDFSILQFRNQISKEGCSTKVVIVERKRKFIIGIWEIYSQSFEYLFSTLHLFCPILFFFVKIPAQYYFVFLSRKDRFYLPCKILSAWKIITLMINSILLILEHIGAQQSGRYYIN